jgi:hypothetical protein
MKYVKTCGLALAAALMAFFAGTASAAIIENGDSTDRWQQRCLLRLDLSVDRVLRRQ